MSYTAEEVEQQSREKVMKAVAHAATRLPIDDLASLLADEADALLVDGLGLAGASRWWRRYKLETCGKACADG